MNIIGGLFQWIKESITHTQAVEYTVNNNRYRIYHNTLDSIDIPDLLPHLLEVKQKIHSATSNQNHRDARYFNVTERTLGTAVKAVWDNLIVTNAYPQTEVGYDQAIRDIVQVHSTDEDRRETLQQIRNARKPRNVTVMAFCSHTDKRDGLERKGQH